MIVPVILAGGSGTRLWPFSRHLYPKQLMPLVDSHTMLQGTVQRLSGLEGIADPIVICNEDHRFLVAEQLRAIDVQPASIILEPAARNTAPAVAVAALKALSSDPDALLIILPADHHLKNIEAFHEAIRIGVQFARDQYLVTFGIVPDYPHTGYGYIQTGRKLPAKSGFPEALEMKRFVEKPDAAKAREYVDSGTYLWNSGMFVFEASVVLSELDKFAPRIAESCREACARGLNDLDFFRLDARAFQACPEDSIDYAVMEKTSMGAVVPLDAGWNDLGSWEALWSIRQKDANDNVTVGDVLIQDVRNCYIHSTGRLIAALGIEDHVIVETSDAVLVSPRSRATDVKALVDRLKKDDRQEALVHKKVYRPWGSFESINAESRFQVKRLTIKPGAMISLQMHHHRAEHWVVVRGTALVTKGNEQFLLREDESTYIPLGVDHRLENPGRIPLELIEVQTGSYLGEDDIVRHDDVYGRKEEH